MKIVENSSSSESRAVIEHLMTGKPIDPEIRKRIKEKAQKIRDRVFREQGLVDVGVSGVRDFRGEISE